MTTPTPYGRFHLLCIFLTLGITAALFFRRKKYSDKQLKSVLAIYGFVALVLELLKQLIWAFDYDPATAEKTWEYMWYAAPFQLCTTPIYASIICLFLKKCKVRDSLLSYMAFFTIIGSIATILSPSSCFTADIIVNIHTMYLHCGSLVLSLYLLFNREIKPNFGNFLKGFYVFLICVFIALTLNIVFYKTGIIGDGTFNMFYISPYFTSELPVFDVIQENVSYPSYLFIYVSAIFGGANIIYWCSYLILYSRFCGGRLS